MALEVVVATAIGQILDIDELMAARLDQQFLIVRQRHVQSARKFALGRRATVFVLQLPHRRLDPAHLATRAARQPVGLPQAIQHGAAYPLYTVGFKLGTGNFFIPVKGIEQPDHSVLDQVIHINTGRQLRHQKKGDALYERNVMGNMLFSGKHALGGVH